MVSGRVKNAVRKIGVEPMYPAEEGKQWFEIEDGVWIQIYYHEFYDLMRSKIRGMNDGQKRALRDKSGRQLTAEMRKETEPPYWDCMNRSGQWKEVSP